jgi:meiosis-specific transcription factor NDT80
MIQAARENYTTSTPHLFRHTLSPRTSSDLRSNYPGLADTPRSVNSFVSFPSTTSAPFSPQSTMYQQTYQPAAPQDVSLTPPFGPQENFDKEYTILDSSGHRVTPTIHGKIEKGFFLANDHTWTCYRRNYFSVQCSYSLDIYTPHGAYFLQRPKHENAQIQAIAMSISAVVDGSGGKAIELIQHTPKRDKGPQTAVTKEKLVPVPPGKQHTDPRTFTAMSTYSQASAYPPPHLPFQTDDNPPYAGASTAGHTPTGQTHQTHTFERIQFKSATANNGKRRAQQQYYHLIIELWVDIRSRREASPEWHKVAQRQSEQVVVRGRSPSHYQAENNQGGAPRGGAGGTGGGSPGSAAFGPSGPRYASSGMGGNLALGGSSGMPGTYRPHQFSLDPGPLTSHSASSSSSISGGAMDGVGGIMKEEDSKSTEGNFEGSYSYYPGPLYENNLPPPAGGKHASSAPSPTDDLRRIKDEHGGAHHGMPPVWPGRCGHFQATESSRGYYPFPEYNTAGY